MVGTVGSIVAEVMNEAAKADPRAVWALINARVPCNQALADHPTIQVGSPGEDPANGFEVGLMGILNGVIGYGERLKYTVDPDNLEAGCLFNVETPETMPELFGIHAPPTVAERQAVEPPKRRHALYIEDRDDRRGVMKMLAPLFAMFDANCGGGIVLPGKDKPRKELVRQVAEMLCGDDAVFEELT